MEHSRILWIGVHICKFSGFIDESESGGECMNLVKLAEFTVIHALGLFTNQYSSCPYTFISRVLTTATMSRI